MDDFISIEKKRICVQLSSRILDLISLINDYMHLFEVKDFYTFSSKNERNASYKNEYRKFIINSTEPIERISVSVAEISSLLVMADRDMDSAASERFKDIFESYLLFESAFANYKKETEHMLSIENISVSSLLDGAKKIKLHIENLLDKVKNTEA